MRGDDRTISMLQGRSSNPGSEGRHRLFCRPPTDKGNNLSVFPPAGRMHKRQVPKQPEQAGSLWLAKSGGPLSTTSVGRVSQPRSEDAARKWVTGIYSSNLLPLLLVSTQPAPRLTKLERKQTTTTGNSSLNIARHELNVSGFLIDAPVLPLASRHHKAVEWHECSAQWRLLLQEEWNGLGYLPARTPATRDAKVHGLSTRPREIYRSDIVPTLFTLAISPVYLTFASSQLPVTIQATAMVNGWHDWFRCGSQTGDAILGVGRRRRPTRALDQSATCFSWFGVAATLTWS